MDFDSITQTILGHLRNAYENEDLTILSIFATQYHLQTGMQFMFTFDGFDELSVEKIKLKEYENIINN